MYNFVSNNFISSELKKSKLFKRNMGHSITSKKNGNSNLSFNKEDSFIEFYYGKHGTIPKKEGNIGSICFFTDHYIKGDIIGVFYKDKDFIFEYDKRVVLSQNIDSYIGSLIKEIETKYEGELSDAKVLKKEKGDPNKVFSDPGNVSYEDMKAYIKNKNKR